MKPLFYLGLAGLSVFEVLKVYFIMPLPGSQEMHSIELAYFLHSWRWIFRISFFVMAAAGTKYAFQNRKKWISVAVTVLSALIIYIFNFRMTADQMFLQPENIILKTQAENHIPDDRLVIGIEHNGEAIAYPVSLLAYHHQIRDRIGGKPIMVTYCNVCRTGRVYEPLVNGQEEWFRLVGMDHFNAMFEDNSTRSWWRQATGEAVTGKLKGEVLPEVRSWQMTLEMWFELFPSGKVMQPDENFMSAYDTLARFEQGKSLGKLTRTDSLSWEPKSWVVGIEIDNESKAYDWNVLKTERIIHDKVGKTSIVLALGSDDQSFVAFQRLPEEFFTLEGDDKLSSGGTIYNFRGENLSIPDKSLKPVQAFQEFWHSWLTFHTETRRYIGER